MKRRGDSDFGVYEKFSTKTTLWGFDNIQIYMKTSIQEALHVPCQPN